MDVKRKKFGFTPLETKVSNRGSNRFLTGFTLAEILTVLGIIALLVGLLLPALSWVRNTAREVKQKAQLTTIGLALTAFKNDYGDYPPSEYTETAGVPQSGYCGAQKLAEALLGRDLLGFHPKSTWSATDLTFYPFPARPEDLNERRGPYLELATTNAFRLGNISVAKPGLFDAPAPLAPDTFVLCDSFGVKPIRVGGKTVKAGTPILYYRANTSSKTIVLPPLPATYQALIYNVLDNYDLIALNRMTDSKPHPLGEPVSHPMWDSKYASFYKYIRDMKVTAASLITWPYRPDSYILISAGADGEYGTGDDITNFGN